MAKRAESETCSILTVAVAAYDDPLKDRPTLRDVGERFAGLFEDATGASTHVGVNVLLTPRVEERQLREKLKLWGSPGSDVGLLLWTSHGERVSQKPRIARLCLSETSLAAHVLADYITQFRFRRWVIIVDSCFAGSIISDLYPFLDGAASSGSCVLVGSSDETEPSDAGVFTEALIRVLREGPQRKWWTAQDRFLEIDEVLKRLDEVLEGLDEERATGVQGAVPKTGGGARAGRAFPNPQYRSLSFPVPLDEPHFLDKARGIEAGQSGWYFTGRQEVLRRLVAWLTQPDRSWFVVTGPAGTGKSAIIGRLVTLSVKEYRDLIEANGALDTEDPSTLPDVGSITAAFHAHEKRADELLRFLADALEVAGARDVDQLIASPRVQRGGVVLVIDALDEAATGHSRRMLDEILSPLARTPGVKVLIGTRPGVADWAREFDLDPGDITDLAAEPTTQADIAAYARQRLLRLADSAYAGKPDLARIIGEGVASRALSDPLADGRRVGSFLVARVLTKTLASQAVIVPEPGWEERLPSGFDEAFESDLTNYRHRLGEQAAVTLRAMLTGLAWDEGQGVPRWLIPALTQAVTGMVITGDEVTTVLQEAGGHLLETQANGWALYRLYHKRLQEHLRQETLRWEPVNGDDTRVVHARITDALIAAGMERDWSDVDPYLAGVLPRHARYGHHLDTLIQTPGYLQVANPPDLLAVLPLTGDGEAGKLIRTYRRAGYTLAGERPDERHLTLEIAAARGGETVELMPSGPFSLRWLRGPATSELGILADDSRAPKPFAVGGIHRMPLAVKGKPDGKLKIWDLVTGTPAREILLGSDATMLAVGESAGRAIAVAGYGDGALRLVDLASGVVRTEMAAHADEITALTVGDAEGRSVAVSGAADGTVRLWSVATGAALGEAFVAHSREPKDAGEASESIKVTALAIGELEDRAVVVSGGEDGTVAIWDPRDGAPIGEPAKAHKGEVVDVALVHLEDRVAAVSAGGGGISIWDLTSGAPAQFCSVQGLVHVQAMGAAEVNSRLVVITSGSESYPDGDVYTVLRIWVFQEGDRWLEGATWRIPGHTGSVGAVEIADIGERTAVITSAQDLTIRIWDLAQLADRDAGPVVSGSPAHSGWVEAVAIGEVNGQAVAVSAGFDDKTLRVWDLATGALLHGPLRGHREGMTSVAVTEVNGRAVTVSGGADGTLRIWDLAQGLAIGEPLGDDDDLPGWADDLTEIDIREIDGRTIAVSAALSGHVRLWDLTKRVPASDKKSKGQGKKKAKKAKMEGQRNFDGVSLGKGKDRHKRTAWAIRTGELRGQPVAVTGGEDGTVRIWDLRARTLIGQPLRGHDGPVRAVAIGDMNGTAVAASGGYDSTVRIWDVATGTPIYEPLMGHTDSVRALAIGKCQGRAVVVSGAEDQTVRVWDLATGSAEACFSVLDRVSDITMESGTILLAAASRVICINAPE